MSNILLHNVEIINIKDYIDDSSLDEEDYRTYNKERICNEERYTNADY